MAAMRWGLLVAALLAFGCADQTPPATGEGPGSGIGGGGRGGNGGDGGAGGEGGNGGGPDGACANMLDMEIIEDASRAMRDVARDCALFCGSSLVETCVSECVRTGVAGLSSECADCYAASERCSFESNCTSRCSLNTCSTNCLDCMNEGDCISDLEACTGLPDQCG